MTLPSESTSILASVLAVRIGGRFGMMMTAVSSFAVVFRNWLEHFDDLIRLLPRRLRLCVRIAEEELHHIAESI